MDFKLIFSELERDFAPHNNFPNDKIMSNSFTAICISALNKSLEYNILLNDAKSDQGHFFLTSFLRGLCEDLIVISYLTKHMVQDRDELCVTYSQHTLLNAIKAQAAFFDKEAPKKQYPYRDDVDFQILKIKEKLSKIMKRNGLKKDRLIPSTEHMAIDAKLKHLYDFLFSATSRMVHFDSYILFRQGWYKDNEDVTFKSYHFEKYYEDFNKFYGAYLYVCLSNTLNDVLELPKNYRQKVKELNKILKQKFYPELITYEELGWSRPNLNCETEI